jgi:predicted NBD/HSP70 family sugar kinase
VIDSDFARGNGVAGARPLASGYVGFSAPAALSRDPRVQLLGLLRRFGTLTRADLAEHLGVTTAMVGEWIADLAQSQLIEDAGKGQSRGGRPPQRVTLAGSAAHAVGLDMSGWPVRAVVRDLVGRVLFEATLTPDDVASLGAPVAAGAAGTAAESGAPEPPASNGHLPLPPTSVGVIAGVVEHVIRRSRLPAAEVRAVGIALAGFVDTRRGTHRPKAVPGATSIPLAAALAERLDVPVLIEDMARAAALAEARDGAAAGIADLLFLSLGDRIGAALILHGNLYRGASGIVGELGHIVVDDNGRRCTCGNIGCVQAQASRPAILRQVRDALDAGVVTTMAQAAADPSGLDIDAVVAAAARGDRLAASVLRRAGRDVGRALAAGTNLVGPTMVVLGGYAPSLGDVFVDEVRRVLSTYVVPPVLERMSVGVGVVGASAAVLGAAWGALDLLVETGALVHAHAPRRRSRKRHPLPAATAPAAAAGEARQTREARNAAQRSKR